MKRKHFITLLNDGRLSIYDAHCDPITWVDVSVFTEKENLTESQVVKLNKLLDGEIDEIVLILPEIAY